MKNIKSKLIVFTYKMITKQLKIKNKFYYFYKDLINVLNFEANNLKIDKKSWKDIDIYYVGYVDKKPDWNVNSVNPLYLIVNRICGSVTEKNSIKFLIIDKEDAVLGMRRLIIILDLTKLNLSLMMIYQWTN